MNSNLVYCFQYNYCIYEGSFDTISIHKTIKGAYNAMRKHLLNGYEIWRENGLRLGKQQFKFGEYEYWRIIVMYVNE